MPLDIRGLGNYNEKSGSGAIQQTIWWLSWQVDLTRMIWLWYDSWFMMYTDDWTMDLVQWIDGGWRGWWLTSGVGACGVLALYMMLPKTVVFLACTEKNDPETECPIRDCSVLYFLLHSGFPPNLYGATRHLYTRALVEALHRVQSSFEIL